MNNHQIKYIINEREHSKKQINTKRKIDKKRFFWTKFNFKRKQSSKLKIKTEICFMFKSTCSKLADFFGWSLQCLNFRWWKSQKNLISNYCSIHVSLQRYFGTMFSKFINILLTRLFIKLLWYISVDERGVG